MLNDRALPWNPDEADQLANNYLRDMPESFWDVAVWSEYGWNIRNIDVAERKRIVMSVLEWLE